MSAMTDYLELALGNHILRGTPFTMPTTLHIGLSTTATTDAGGYTEPSGNAYARVAYTCNTANWTAPTTAGLFDNVNAITFPTATGSWGTITHIFIADAATGGNVLFHGPLSVSVAVAAGQTFSISVGALDITFS